MDFGVFEIRFKLPFSKRNVEVEDHIFPDFSFSKVDISKLDADTTADIIKSVFENNFSHFRSLNETMMRIPVFCGTVTGGTLYFVVEKQFLSSSIGTVMLIVVGTINIFLGLAVRRIRDVIQSYIDNLNHIVPGSVPSTKRGPGRGLLTDFGIVKLIQCVVFLMALIMYAYAIYGYAIPDPIHNPTSTPVRIHLFQHVFSP